MFLYKIIQNDKEVFFDCNDSTIGKQDLINGKLRIIYTYEFDDFYIESDFPIDFTKDFTLLKKTIQKKYSSNDNGNLDFLKNIFGMK